MTSFTKIAVALVTFALGCLLPLAARADATRPGIRLVHEKQCMQCHSVDKDTIGPSFRTIRAIYKNVKQPESQLIEVMRHGSDANLGPHWGLARMPDSSERPLMTDEEARAIARWILSPKPSEK
jgi:cytochrome c